MQFKRRIATLLLLMTILTAFGCMSKNTSDAEETFKYWAEVDKVPPGIKLLEGQYWQSPHFTKEYIMYLKFKTSGKWWKELLKINNLHVDAGDWSIPEDAPEWFRPSSTFTRYGSRDEFDQGSRYFRDHETGICYIYEIQL